MTNGADEQLHSVGPEPIEGEGGVSGRTVPEQPAGDRATSSLLSNPQSALAGPTSEWDTYVDTQIRHDWVDLPHDERAFCEEYLVNGYNHRDASEAIDRPASSGIRLLNKPLCREYILWTEHKKRARSLITEQFMESQLFQTLDQANGDVDVPLVTGSGIKIVAKKFNGPLKLAVLQEMGKLSGISKPEVSDVNLTVVIDVGALIGEENKNRIVSEQ